MLKMYCCFIAVIALNSHGVCIYSFNVCSLKYLVCILIAPRCWIIIFFFQKMNHSSGRRHRGTQIGCYERALAFAIALVFLARSGCRTAADKLSLCCIRWTSKSSHSCDCSTLIFISELSYKTLSSDNYILRWADSLLGYVNISV